MRKGIWTNGSSFVTGSWIYNWGVDEFYIELDARPKGCKLRNLDMTIKGDHPQFWGYRLLDPSQRCELVIPKKINDEIVVNCNKEIYLAQIRNEVIWACSNCLGDSGIILGSHKELLNAYESSTLQKITV